MIDKASCAARSSKLRESLKGAGLEGVVLVPGPNMEYLTGVESLLLERPLMLLFPLSGEAQLVSPALEAGPYRDSPMRMEIHDWTDSEGSPGAIANAARSAGVKGTWGIEGKVPYLFLHRLMKHVSPRFDDAEPVLQSLREVKDAEEIMKLKKSAKILSRAFSGFPGLVKEGRTEIELAKDATEMIYENGATKVDAMLVQSGWRAADPHSLPSTKKVKREEGIIFDVGATFEGYYADITRTICVGRAQEVEEVYEKVLEAEENGIRAGAAGVEVGRVDEAARRVLRKAGLGKHFIHRTGHGLGLEVHEAPYIVEGGKERLGPGMCYTVEPGVYIRGRLGVRIEDDVLIERRTRVELTDTPKEFGWWR